MSASSERLLQLMLEGVDKLDLPLTVRQVEGLAHDVAKGFDVHTVEPLVDDMSPQLAMPHVTAQQYAVWMGIVAGETVEATARRLCVGSDSVRTHRRSLYRRLGVSTTAGAVAQAALCGLVTEASTRSAGVPR